ncbi:MAG: response regulator [Deltaproteobacteria bacterium]|nr:response regulator [Deltaproteobacteria bacterium]
MDSTDELMEVFREEAAELIDKIAVQIESLRNAPPKKHRDIMVVILRVAHNLKGAARVVGVTDIENLAHAVEDALQPLRDNPEALTEERIQEILEGVTVMQLVLEGKEGSVRAANELVERLGSDAGEQKKETTALRREPADPDRPAKEPVVPDQPAKETADAGHRFEEGTSIRVDTARFDRVMDFAGELLVSQARMDSRHRRLDNFYKELQRIVKKAPGTADLLTPLINEIRQLIQEDRKELLDFGHLTAEINDAMKQVRMVPLKKAEPVWRRTIREAAHHLGKQIKATVFTGDIELDKHVLDLLRDPMTHLLRNAADHGIEPPDERVSKGKPRSGQVFIKAGVMGAMVHLEVSDDGRGIDLGKVRDSLIAKEIITAEKNASLSDEDALEYLFIPGFSTATSVSRLSGRGVGLDVVRSQVEELGGSVTISSSSRLGGITFQLSVPLSILSTLGLFVRVNDTTYALPVEYVVRTLRAKHGDIKQVDGKPIVQMSDADPIRIAWLSDLMGSQVKNTSGMLKVVVLSRFDVQLGLVVDAIEGQQEFVIKALPWNFTSVPGVNGAVIREDGRLAISIDVPHLFNTVRFPTGQARRQTRGKLSSTKRRVLVVDDSMASRTMGRNILQEAGYDVTLAADGQEAWELLQKEPFELVVSDVDMPRLDGLGLTRMVRGSDKLRGLPVILVTSLDSPEDIAAGADAGADEYVVKGTFDQNSLLELVTKYI